MDTAESLSMGLYLAWTLLAFLGGLSVSFIVTFGLAWGGTGSLGFDFAALFGNLSTLGLFVGLVTCASRRKVFVVVTLMSAAFVPVVIACIFAPVLWRPKMLNPQGGNIPLPWLLVLLVDVVEIVLAIARLRQLSEPR